jgi:hypothetical protein
MLHIVIAASEHFVVGDFGSMQSEYTFFFEMFSELEDSLFECAGGFVMESSRLGFFIVKVDTVESFSFAEG